MTDGLGLWSAEEKIPNKWCLKENEARQMGKKILQLPKTSARKTHRVKQGSKRIGATEKTVL